MRQYSTISPLFFASDNLITVVGGLEGSGLGHVDVCGLRVAEDGELGAQLLEVERSDLLVQVLGQDVHLLLVLAGRALVPQLQLGNDLGARDEACISVTFQYVSLRLLLATRSRRKPNRKLAIQR